MLSRALLPFVVGVLCAVLLLSSPAPTSAAVCGGSGYDLSSITFSDIVYNDTKRYVWYFHPCGNVTYSGCQGLESTTPGGVMLCQYSFTGTGAYPVATWVPENTQAVTTWTPYGGNQGNRGVRMSLQDGGSCGGTIGARSLTVNFQCNNQLAAGFATFTTINETSTCVYVMTVQTSAVCAGPNATTNGQVACGTTGLNLASITTTDLIWKDTAHNYTYYYRPCGVVTSPQCANNPYGAVAGEAMMCQATGTNGELDPNTYDISWWNPTLAAWSQWTYNGNNGWQLFIQDGTTCAGAGNGISRALTVYFVCSTTATTPIFSFLNETSTCNYAAVVLTVLACNQSQISTTTSQCGGPYDLSFATQRDLIYQPAGTNAYYVFRPCGIVDNAQCQANGNTNQSMMCQAYQGQSNTNDISIYNPTLVTYTPTLTGISMYIADGDLCGGYGARSLTVNFVCNPNAAPQAIAFTGWSENPTCTYTATVTTGAVCRRGRNNGLCGSQGYDFSLSGGTDYAFTTSTGTYTYYFQPCGQVLNTQCNANNATQSSMMCQAVNGQTTTYDIAFYDANLVQWYKLTNGMQMFVQDGTSCGSLGYERALTMNFICGSGAAVFNNFTEVTTCNYVGYITTPQACAPVAAGGSTGVVVPVVSSTGSAFAYETITQCGGVYNLLPLSTTDLTYQSNGYLWVFRPCGAVSSNSNCTTAAAGTTGGWMLCQDSLTGTGNYEGSSYNQYTVSWTATRNGVIMTQSDGAVCGALGNRVTRANFVCNPSATTAVMTNVTEGPTCTYTLTIQTNLVCPTAATVCGGAGYNLSALTTRGDLVYTNTTIGYSYYFSPCGTVQNSQCQSNVLSQSAMACQASLTSNSSYNLAVYVPQVTTWTAIPGGVQMMVQDGSTCDNYDFLRVFTANFLCGQTQGPYSMTVVEQTLCNYVATVNTGLICSQIGLSSSAGGGGGGGGGGATSTNGPTPTSAAGLPATSASTPTTSTGAPAGGTTNSGGGGGSSLSGGAIAGIVIGSIVGALIILAVLLVLCFAGGRRKKASETGEDRPATGRYGDVESEASQSGVEMQNAETHGETAPA